MSLNAAQRPARKSQRPTPKSIAPPSSFASPQKPFYHKKRATLLTEISRSFIKGKNLLFSPSSNHKNRQNLFSSSRKKHDNSVRYNDQLPTLTNYNPRQASHFAPTSFESPKKKVQVRAKCMVGTSTIIKNVKKLAALERAQSIRERTAYNSFLKAWKTQSETKSENKKKCKRNRLKTIGILTQERIRDIHKLTLDNIKVTEKKKAVNAVLVRTPSIGSILGDVEDQVSNSSTIVLREVFLLSSFITKAASFNDADYWLHRGNIYSNNKQLELAIDCYRQGLRLDKNHVGLLYNLGCAFEQRGNYTRSLKCFTHLAETQPTMREAFYGIALCQFKLEDFGAALYNIEVAVKDWKDEKVKGKHYTYLRALCHKQLDKFNEAGMYYNELQAKIAIYNEKLLEPLLVKYYKIDDGWKTDKKKEVISILHRQPFFMRFNTSQLEQILKAMKVKTHPANSLFFLYKHEIAVILQGEAIIYSHTSDLNKPQVIAEYGPGSIIGYPSDSGVSRHPENWVRTKSQIEFCAFTKDYFDVNKLYHNIK